MGDHVFPRQPGLLDQGERYLGGTRRVEEASAGIQDRWEVVNVLSVDEVLEHGIADGPFQSLFAGDLLQVPPDFPGAANHHQDIGECRPILPVVLEQCILALNCQGVSQCFAKRVRNRTTVSTYFCVASNETGKLRPVD